ncbi:MAG: LemA family protein [Candidatus Micrarchaeota archaeon]
MDILLTGLIAVVLVVVLYVILAYNSLVTLRNRIDNAWSMIDVQLRRRYDLIPNLVETVKGYAKHERQTFEMVTKARSAMLAAKTPGDKAKADNMLTGALKTLFAIAEAYPKLEASENFKALQEELSSTESKIAFARQFYNDNVLALNTSIQTFPSNVIAGVLGFQLREYYDAGGAEARKLVKVSF